ncbi:MAG TPA: hypothetical protein VG248_01975 [Caulobacteraceae bacterium]|jgi:hypothetical protein|nr:hypothetical protein [Caulobacteraceae bacterium]
MTTGGEPRGRLPVPIFAAALFVTLIIGVELALRIDARHALGDTDDAMRLVMVRDLAGGRGWYDQLVPRLGSTGVWMHWSRLVDGGEAGLLLLLRPFSDPATAEWRMRILWPLMWIAPTIVAVLALSRALGGSRWLIISVLLLLTVQPLYGQFVPGRIDHHNVQITMALVALACAAGATGAAGGAAAGAATAAGLAVGLEALPFHVLAGAALALRYVGNERGRASLAGYGVALAAGATLLFGLQTPPARWGQSACDSLGVNYALGLFVSGVGLTLATLVRRAAGPAGRGALVAATVGAAALVWFWLDPACVHGPFAGMDRQVRVQWLERVQEVQPLWKVWASDRQGALAAAAALAAGAASAAGLVTTSARRSPGTLLALAAFIAAAVLGIEMWRMMAYVFWLAVILEAAALSRLVDAVFKGRLVSAIAVGLAASPMVLAIVLLAAVQRIEPRHGPAPPSVMAAEQRCFLPGAYASLARDPPGAVLAAPDLGPFILAFTPHRALAAPYHRMAPALGAAEAALGAPAVSARAEVRALGARYVVDCPLLVGGTPDHGLIAALRRGAAPPWLTRRSAPGDLLGIYEVR